MKNLSKIATIRKLAKEFGTPLKSAEFIGDGVVFVYTVGGKDHPRKYPHADRGIEKEVIRLERLLALEI